MIRQRGKSYQVDITVGGKRKRKQFASWSEAKAWEDAQLTAEGLPVSSDTYTSESLSGAVKRLQPVLWDDTDHSLKVKRNLEEALEILGEISIDRFDNTHVETLLSHYKSIGNSNATINRKFASLSKLFRHLHRSRAIDHMPYFPRQKESQGRIRFLTEAEEDRLFHFLRQFNEHHHRLAVFLIDTGARFSEALDLEWRDIDPNQRTATFWETKSNQSRTVYLTSRALSATEAGKEDSKPFSAANRWTFRDHWAKAKDYAGLGNDDLVVPHILRHTCASRLVQRGMDLRRVQEWMGHKSMQMTMRYAHLAPRDLKLCVDVLERGRGEMADATDLKSVSDRSEGSSPSVRTRM